MNIEKLARKLVGQIKYIPETGKVDEVRTQVAFEYIMARYNFVQVIPQGLGERELCVMCKKQEAGEGFEYCEFCEDRYNECKESGGF